MDAVERIVVERAEAMLTALQWAAEDSVETDATAWSLPRCPVCSRYEDKRDHEPDCDLWLTICAVRETLAKQ